MAQNVHIVNQSRDDSPDTPVAWMIADLPQNIGVAYGVCLIYACGRTGQIAMSSRSHRGIRQQMRTHPRYRDLRERVLTPDASLFATVRAIKEGERR